MSRLTFFRQRSVLGMEVIPGQQNPQCMTLQGYQYKLNKQLVEAEAAHQGNNLLQSLNRFNIYRTDDKKFVGQVCWMPWQDGAAVTYSGTINPPHVFFKPFFNFLKVEAIVMKDISGEPLWISSVVDLKKDDFIKIVKTITLDGRIHIEEDTKDEQDLPWMRGPKEVQ